MRTSTIFAGLLLLSIFLWKDRGMLSGSVGWPTYLGPLVLASWGAFGLIQFTRNRVRPSEDISSPLCLGVLLIQISLLLVETQTMYAAVAKENPQLLMTGPIQSLPSNLFVYVKPLLWLCLFFVLGLLLQPTQGLWNKILGISLFFGAFLVHLLVLRAVPFPLIDVFTVITEATTALLEGRNPYSIQYFDIYGGKGITPSGFGYPPGIFPWTASGMLFFGDVRGGNLLALLGMGLIFIVGLSHQPWSVRLCLATFCLLSGPSLFVSEQGWVDPMLAVLILVTLLFAHLEKYALASFFGGWLCVTKQYGFIAFLFVLLMILNQRDLKTALRFLLLAILTGILFQVPFLLNEPAKYFHSVFVVLWNSPTRPDSYSLFSMASWLSWPAEVFPLFGGIVVLFLTGLIWIKKTTEPTLVAGAISLAYLWIFLTNRVSFCNYYFLVFLTLLSSLFFAARPAVVSTGLSRKGKAT